MDIRLLADLLSTGNVILRFLHTLFDIYTHALLGTAPSGFVCISSKVLLLVFKLLHM